jgi:hypothetical protein
MQLRRLLQDYAELLATSGNEEPGLIPRTALSTVLQSFYQGVESIFETVATRVDRRVPTGAGWHRQLIDQMAEATGVRLSLISKSTVDRLEPYLGFRHLARHTYPFVLEWSRMRLLVQELVTVSEQFSTDVQAFLEHAGQSGPSPK